MSVTAAPERPAAPEAAAAPEAPAAPEASAAPEVPMLAFVSGFLGSGKTTAIVGVCRLLAARGVRTAIVTNDQGRHQVDLAFARAAGVPALAVADGCLCCRYDDFEARVRALVAEARPQVVFAEAVGSCTDLVATVSRPFEAFRARHGATAGRLSTFVDVRLLEAFLAGRRLPFGRRVLYLFERQLDEAEIVVVNQRDRVSSERGQAAALAAQARWPDAPALLASAFDEDDLWRWYDHIRSSVPRRSVDVDVEYDRYTEAELALAWLDRSVRLRDEAGADLGPVVFALLAATARRLCAAGHGVGHLKAHARGDAGEAKLGLAAGDVAEVGSAGTVRVQGVDGRVEAGGLRLGSDVDLLVNLRAVGDPATVAACLDAALAEIAAAGVTAETRSGSAFRPGVPRPQHRLRHGAPEDDLARGGG